SIRVGSGIGPWTSAPVRLAVSTISWAVRSSTSWSNASIRMRMRSCAKPAKGNLLNKPSRQHQNGNLGIAPRLVKIATKNLTPSHEGRDHFTAENDCPRTLLTRPAWRFATINRDRALVKIRNAGTTSKMAAKGNG